MQGSFDTHLSARAGQVWTLIAAVAFSLLILRQWIDHPLGPANASILAVVWQLANRLALIGFCLFLLRRLHRSRVVIGGETLSWYGVYEWDLPMQDVVSVRWRRQLFGLELLTLRTDKRCRTLQLWRLPRSARAAVVQALRKELLGIPEQGWDRRFQSRYRDFTTCPQCCYPLRGLSQRVCPECGSRAPDQTA
jgi:hypothetical protein